MIFFPFSDITNGLPTNFVRFSFLIHSHTQFYSFRLPIINVMFFLYSILREEREAELDSELIIESCDASSASEESPKREQDSPPMKPGALDAIREEPGTRAEERAHSQQGLAEPGPFLKFPSAAPQVCSELPSGDGAPVPEGSAVPRTPVEAASYDQSSQATKGPGPQGPGVAPPLLFLNKQQGKVTAFLIEVACLAYWVL